MPSLEEVPSPVLILIAKSVPDLVSLHSLRLASPVCAALLSDVLIGAEIVEEVASLSMAKYNGDIFGYIWQLLQGAEFTQTEPFGVTKILAPHPTAESTLQLLALARVVHDTAHRCLHTLLRRFVALQPRRLIDITFDLRRQRFWKPSNSDFIPAPQPPSEAFNIDRAAADAPFEWVEAERALNGAWLLALFAILGDIDPATPNTGNQPSEAQCLHMLQVGILWDHENARTVLDCFNDEEQSHLRLTGLFSSAPSCHEAGCSVNARPADSAWEPGPGGLGRSHWPTTAFASDRTVYYSPIRHVRFAPYRSLGFKFWEESRLTAKGLVGSRDLVNAVGHRLVRYGACMHGRVC